MARIVTATFPLAQGQVIRNVPQGATILSVRVDGAEGRVFAVVPNPAAPLEVRKLHVMPTGIDLPAASPGDFEFIGTVTHPTSGDWHVFERVIG